MNAIWSDNNCICGHGMARLKAELDSGVELSQKAIHAVWKCCFNIPLASKAFVDGLHWEVLQCMGRTFWEYLDCFMAHLGSKEDGQSIAPARTGHLIHTSVSFGGQWRDLFGPVGSPGILCLVHSYLFALLGLYIPASVEHPRQVQDSNCHRNSFAGAFSSYRFEDAPAQNYRRQQSTKPTAAAKHNTITASTAQNQNQHRTKTPPRQHSTKLPPAQHQTTANSTAQNHHQHSTKPPPPAHHNATTTTTAQNHNKHSTKPLPPHNTHHHHHHPRPCRHVTATQN